MTEKQKKPLLDCATVDTSRNIFVRSAFKPKDDNHEYLYVEVSKELAKNCIRYYGSFNITYKRTVNNDIYIEDIA